MRFPIPNDLENIICSYLDLFDLVNIASTSNSFNQSPPIAFSLNAIAYSSLLAFCRGVLQPELLSDFPQVFCFQKNAVVKVRKKIKELSIMAKPKLEAMLDSTWDKLYKTTENYVPAQPGCARLDIPRVPAHVETIREFSPQMEDITRLANGLILILKCPLLFPIVSDNYNFYLFKINTKGRHSEYLAYLRQLMLCFELKPAISAHNELLVKKAIHQKLNMRFSFTRELFDRAISCKNEKIIFLFLDNGINIHTIELLRNSLGIDFILNTVPDRIVKEHFLAQGTINWHKQTVSAFARFPKFKEKLAVRLSQEPVERYKQLLCSIVDSPLTTLLKSIFHAKRKYFPPSVHRGILRKISREHRNQTGEHSMGCVFTLFGIFKMSRSTSNLQNEIKDEAIEMKAHTINQSTVIQKHALK